MYTGIYLSIVTFINLTIYEIKTLFCLHNIVGVRLMYY